MTLIDPEKTKLLTPLTVAVGALVSVATVSWVLATARSDMLGAIAGNRAELTKINESLIELNSKVGGLSNDHEGFVRRSDLRVIMLQLRALNDGVLREGDQKGLRIPPQD